MPNHSAGLDDAFRALADPTRRAVIARLARGPASTTTLATPFPMALPSFMQHLAALEGVGLVTSRKVGRSRTWTLAPDRLREAETWLTAQRSTWERRLDQLDRLLLEEDAP
jgi:DNA-binding transcriptional ArsR family regulator